MSMRNKIIFFIQDFDKRFKFQYIFKNMFFQFIVMFGNYVFDFGNKFWYLNIQIKYKR